MKRETAEVGVTGLIDYAII